MRLDPAFAARAETSTRAADTPRPRPCVLVVDDEPQITRSVAELLAPDYEVVTAGSADEALALLAQRSFHVILSDQRMPRGNGSVLLARSLHVAPETTRILFTGYSDISAVIDAVNEGQVYHYLAKPWRPEELRAVVEQGVERYRLVTQNRRLLDELQIANRELEAANRELNEFVAWVAHDLRSPLRALDGFSLILSDDFGDDLDDTAKHHLARIRAASRRLGELFDAQITLTETGRRPIALAAVDLAAAARRVTDELQRGEPGRVVDIVVADDMQATTDPELVRLVLRHFIGNAWKFTSRKAQARIEVGALPGEADLVFFVRDNGAGFDVAYADKLFVPFERLHTREEFAGTGIGLTIARRALDRLGGRCWAEGEIGSGATFFFTLPV